MTCAAPRVGELVAHPDDEAALAEGTDSRTSMDPSLAARYRVGCIFARRRASEPGEGDAMTGPRTPARRTLACALGLVLMLIVAGCAKRGKAESAGPGSESLATEPYNAPSTEGTGPEPPQHGGGDGPSLTLPHLPAGGQATPEGAVEQCAEVSWTGVRPIPPDITVTIDKIASGNEAIFGIGGGGCAGSGDQCVGWKWTAQNDGDACRVPARQKADVAEQTVVPLVLAGSIHCASQPACDEFAAKSGQDTSVGFVAIPGVFSGSTNGPTPSEPAPSTQIVSGSPSGIPSQS
jgi:hypothetical protein